MTFIGGVTALNAHSMMKEQLQSHLNRNHSLTEIIHILHETYGPLSSIAKLPIIPQLGILLVSLKSNFPNNFLQFIFFTETTIPSIILHNSNAITDFTSIGIPFKLLPGNSFESKWIRFY